MAHDLELPDGFLGGESFRHLELQYTMSEALGPIPDELPDLRRWDVSIVEVDDRNGASTEVGSITVRQIVFPVHDDPREILDAESAELAEYVILFDDTGEIDVTVLNGDLAVAWPLTILGDIELIPELRGHGIGPWAAARVLRTLARQGLVACYPIPGDLPYGSDEQAIQGLRLAELAKELGFTLFRDNVYVLDAATTDLDVAIERIETGLRS